MQAQVEPAEIDPMLLQPRIAQPGLRHADVVVPLRPGFSPASDTMDLPQASRLAPARGLMIGLLAGAVLWAGLFVLAWAVFR